MLIPYGEILFLRAKERLQDINKFVSEVSFKLELMFYTYNSERYGGLMVSALDLGSRGSCSSPGWGQCVVFLSKVDT